MKQLPPRRFKTGDLVEIEVERLFTDDGLATAYTQNNGICLYEKIDLISYPSCNDFMGETIYCPPGQVGTIMRYLGRPFAVRRAGGLWMYDVYEVLVEGSIVQVFANNLQLTQDVQKAKER